MNKRQWPLTFQRHLFKRLVCLKYVCIKSAMGDYSGGAHTNEFGMALRGAFS